MLRFLSLCSSTGRREAYLLVRACYARRKVERMIDQSGVGYH